MSLPQSRLLIGGLILIFAVAGVLTAGRLTASSNSVSGQMSFQSFAGPECTSAVGICSRGELKGGLKGTSTFVASEVLATSETPTTAVVVIAGETTISTKTGTLICKDSGSLQTVGDGAFVTICSITGGSGVFTGATGYLQVVGTFDPDTGGEAEYSGRIIVP